MEGFMFSTPIIISPVDVEPQISDMDEIMENSIGRAVFEPIVEPYEGMEFESEESARTFYHAYAAQIGFKVRVSSFIRSKRDKTIISRQLVCSREGFRSTRDESAEGKTKRPRMITRVGCRAMIMVKKQISGQWIISKCEKIHNHVLGTQGKVVMLDYDPYVREDDQMLENPIGNGLNLHDGGIDNEMMVLPAEGEPGLEPQLGMEFESEQDAQVFYKGYARNAGFRARVSSYYRSKRDNSIISRLIVCSKEGFRTKKEENADVKLQRPRAITRVGCKAMIMVKRRDSGKWVVSKLVKHHNHELTLRRTVDGDYSESDDEMAEVETTLNVPQGDATAEPYIGMEFESEEAAKTFYFAYSKHIGFNMRVSTYYRSKRDKSIISRLFVCSKEGFYVKKDGTSERKAKRSREATRVGCRAMLMVKKNNSGQWVVSKFEREHNHPLGSSKKLWKSRKNKTLSCGNKQNHVELQHSDHESPTLRYNNLCREAMKYAEVGAVSPDVYNVAMLALEEATKKVSSVKRNGNAATKHVTDSNATSLEDCNQDGLNETSIFTDQQSRNSQPSSDQSKSGFEKHHNMRICNTCRQQTDHTSRSCPFSHVELPETPLIHCEDGVLTEEPSNQFIQQPD